MRFKCLARDIFIYTLYNNFFLLKLRGVFSFFGKLILSNFQGGYRLFLNQIKFWISELEKFFNFGSWCDWGENRGLKNQFKNHEKVHNDHKSSWNRIITIFREKRLLRNAIKEWNKEKTFFYKCFYIQLYSENRFCLLSFLSEYHRKYM